MTHPNNRRLFVHLAYIDDSGGTDTRCDWSVFAAVLIPDHHFFWMEPISRSSALVTFGEAEFSEFHARDLFRGTGEFAGYSEEQRLSAISQVICSCLNGAWEVSIVYGAVNRRALPDTLYASIDPADVAFRKCLLGIERVIAAKQEEGGHSTPVSEGAKWIKSELRKHDPVGYTNDLCVLMMDDTGDTKLKDRLRKTYRDLRKSLKFSKGQTRMDNPRGHLAHFHDSLYFGDSADSIGIQFADLCAYFIGLHLMGDESGSQFYAKFKDSIAASAVFPDEGIPLL